MTKEERRSALLAKTRPLRVGLLPESHTLPLEEYEIALLRHRKEQRENK